MELPEWNNNLGNRSLALLQYAQAWSVIYYVMNDNSSGNRDILMKYLSGIQAGKRGEDALRYAFGDGFDGFRQGWLLYIKDLTN
jgi:hypothetical protein